MGRNGQGLRISVIGTGYLGLTHAVCMADLGHQVLAIDTDAEKLAKAARGEAPFFEPGLEPLLRKNLDAGRLRFTSSFAEIGEFGDVHFICVGTPQVKDGGGNADLSYVYGAAEAVAPHLTRPTLVVGKSTVPVGTSRQVIERLHAAAPARDQVDFAFNPEFLREGYAVQDSLTPDRIVFGVTSAAADELMREVYAIPLSSGIPGLTMDLETAELVKVAANSFLATKISFINVMAEMCEASGADVIKLADAIGIDERIGRKFLSPGLGFGGGCLPKDIRAFRATAAERGVESLVNLLTTVDTINLGRRDRIITLARAALGGDLAGKRIAVLGAAFKPNSDDIRDSPALDVAAAAFKAGAVVTVYDPKAMDAAKRVHPELDYADTVEGACLDADVVLHLTEWKQFREIDPAKLASVVANPAIIDGRNALDPTLWREADWTFRALGRPTV
jgi:UDPglucose 6-dehydrogenase